MNPGYRLAVKEANRSLLYFRVSCAVMQGSRLVSRGVNKDKTHTRSTVPTRTIHAEMDAIFSISLENLRGATVYVARVLQSTGELSLARPCESCYEMLENSGVKKIVFSMSGGWSELCL